MAILKLKELLQRRGAIAFFLDASDAFGCIKWSLLFTKLDRLNFDRNITAAISRLYHLSHGRVVWRGATSRSFILKQGVRQGGCISGHLFNIYFASLDICDKICAMIFYADDLVIVVYHPWAAVIVLDKLRKLSIELNVNWNPDKCKVLQMSSTSTHGFEWYGKVLENVSRFVYLGWIIVRKLRCCDDEQAARQAGKFYAAAHDTSQAYKFTQGLPMKERVDFAKTIGGVYAPEAFTSVSEKAMSKMRNAHRYLFMRLTGWNGVECYDEEKSVSSETIGSDDSAEEYYDCRSRWLYAYVATAKKSVVYSGIRAVHAADRLEVDFLHPAPTLQYQFRKARARIQRVVKKLDLELNLPSIRLSNSMKKILAPA